ncbi:MAG: response regulator transcription factor [Ilumatobacteraceae bacterium]
MNVRTPVFVYAADPVSQAGLEQLLRRDAGILVLASGHIDEAHVAVIGTDHIDEGTVRAISGIQRDGCPRVVVVAGRIDDDGVLAAGDAGALGLLRRADATPDALGRVVRQVAAGEASIPTDLVGPLLGAVRRLRRGGGSAPFAPASLTGREQDVIRLLAEGRDTAEIAASLNYSERTVKGVIHEVTSRLQLRNRSHVVAYALRNDML